ncbi:MAG: SCO family protein [Burkholderiaceae bacterium]
MRPKFLSRAAVLCAALAMQGAASAAEDHSRHASHPAAALPAKPSTVKVRYDDSVLTDRTGKALKLKTDVIAERIVVLDFVYTTCTTVCPVLTALLAEVRQRLDPDAEPEVRFVSITVDPARDTPARLKEYADRHGIEPGWFWLTGPTGRINEVLKGFGAYAPSFEDHPPQVLVGDARSGQWTRFYGFADPKAVLAKVNELRAARANGHHAGDKH